VLEIVFDVIVMMSVIRPYTRKDQDELVALLRLNTPAFFHPAEEQELVRYLAQEAQNYFVVEEVGRIVGAGGFNRGFDGGQTVRISWDIIHPDFQGRGIGTQLTLYRIDQIKKDPSVKKIVVRTSQLVYVFYQKLGFVLEKTEKDYWAVGFDLYQMQLAINSGGAC